MGDWELFEGDSPAPQQQAAPTSDWEMVQPAPNSQQPPSQGESFGTSLMKAQFRMGEDAYRGAFGALKNLPDMIDLAKTELPPILRTALLHEPLADPHHALGQLMAGAGEMGHNLLNMPSDIAQYGANRLNLIPPQIANAIPRQGDISQDINQLFGQPRQPGERLIRGAARNALNILGGGSAANMLNPMNLTAKSIANNVLRAEKKQIATHSKMYDQLWNEADKTGFNNVPVDKGILKQNLKVVRKYKTPKEYESLNQFIKDPTLSNAQKAQSDMGAIHRKLQEKSYGGSLTGEEQALYKAAHEAEKHIEQNMFKNAKGEVNQPLQDKYGKVTTSYREHVVPYKYNENIQLYKNRKMLPKDLVNSLSRGEFAVKKGWAHPAIKVRNALLPTAAGIGATGFAKMLYDNMMGSTSPNTNQ